MAIARRLVGLMGGELTVRSETGIGTTFSFTSRFERATPAERPVAADPSSHARLSPTGARTRVLLAEDNEVNQLYVTTLLKKLGCEVTVANDGEEAFAHWQARPFDAILMDWHMPLLDGLQATALIREEERRHGLRPTPIIGATASALEDERRLCIDAGMNAVLCKPFAPDELVAVLERHRVQDAAHVRGPSARLPMREASGA